jgi:cytochrome c oxidase assembly factor CtaG
VLLSVLLRLLVNLGLWTIAFAAWHVPTVYDYAAAHPLVHGLEHLSFIVAGTLAWTQLVDPARHGRLRRPQRVFFALAMLAVSQPLVDVLLFTHGPVYSRYVGAHGLSALTDQRLAGVVMMTEQLLTLGICVALLLWPYIRLRERARPAALSHGSR